MAVSYSNMPSKELAAALEAARAAEEVIRSLFGRNPAVRTKPDQSPVTEADVRAEELIRATLSRHFPSYGFYGEETGQHAMQAESIWLVDPIDGTKSFVRESPFFSTQIALMRGGRFVLGVSNAPAYGELAWAEQGAGAWLNERSEEHTSELQSRLHFVCRLLLEKKKIHRPVRPSQLGASTLTSRITSPIVI